MSHVDALAPLPNLSAEPDLVRIGNSPNIDVRPAARKLGRRPERLENSLLGREEAGNVRDRGRVKEVTPGVARQFARREDAPEIAVTELRKGSPGFGDPLAVDPDSMDHRIHAIGRHTMADQNAPDFPTTAPAVFHKINMSRVSDQFST